MAIQRARQRGARASVWFDAAAVDNGDGTITIPATSFWLRGAEYPLGVYTTPNVGADPFRIFIERAADGVDYLLDTTGLATPASFGPHLGAPVVVWRDVAEGPIEVLRSVPDA